jgi:hypothetical protein
MKKFAIITFDYEVFLGRRTGTIENCVIKPTSAILKILNQNNAKAIFFVDTTWLLFLKENFPSDFQLVAGQLKDIIEAGSSVELHLHTQWLDAYKNEDQVGFNSFDRYRLHSLTQPEINELFKKSVDLLQSITKKNISCFRAGGWCIEPFDRLKEAFEMTGLIYDFSVVPGVTLKENRNYDFDFSQVPIRDFYKFDSNINHQDEEGAFVEFPLTTYFNNPLYRICNKVLLKLRHDKIFGDGTGIKERSVSGFLHQMIRFSKEKLSLDKTSSLVFKYLVSSHLRNNRLIIIVSHPKMLSNEGLNNLLYITNKFNTISSLELEQFLSNNWS